MPPRRIVLAVAAAAALGACKEQPPKHVVGGQALPVQAHKGDDGKEVVYAADAGGLLALWKEIVIAAQRDDREKVHDLMASMIMTENDLIALFGDEKGRWLKPRYDHMIGRVANIGALELVAQVAEKKYDDVEVFVMDAVGDNPMDKAVLAALKVRPTMYSVRVKKKAEKLGMRYDFFIHRDGRWMMGNQIGGYLLPEGTSVPTKGAPRPMDAPAPAPGTAPTTTTPPPASPPPAQPAAHGPETAPRAAAPGPTGASAPGTRHRP